MLHSLRFGAARRAAAGIALFFLAVHGPIAFAADEKPDKTDKEVKRGQYLVTIMGCGDCHTPGYFFGKPDAEHPLSGSEVGFEVPELGVFYGPNLTPDPETGLGNWSEEEMVTAIRTGQRPDGRELAPVMPWRNFAMLTDKDAAAIAAYLRSLPPTTNRVPGPFGPAETPTSFVMKIIPPGQ